MLFNSLTFIIFFGVVTAIYFLMGSRQWPRVIWLIGASFFFYMWAVPKYILIILAATSIDYVAGILIENTKNAKKKKFILIGGVSATLSILFVFKYFDFFLKHVNWSFKVLGADYSFPYLHLILPVGLSFHIFQSLSYVFEVYFGRQKAERNWLYYCLFVTFYPQLVAGPIERPQKLFPQLRNLPTFNYSKAASGLRLMGWGLFKKMVISDNLSGMVDMTFASAPGLSSLTVWLGVIFFSFQIYCDFSGYTDVARGAARVMGLDLMQNFNRPYFATSPVDFWRRWHISLSSWFRDYFYVSIGGNRQGFQRRVFNVWLTFLVSGLWHGANWTFIIWGFLHGFFVALQLCLERLWGETQLPWAKNPYLLRAQRSVQILLTFLLVTLAWIFFRAPSVSSAVDVFKKLATFDLSIYPYFSVVTTGFFGSFYLLPQFQIALICIVVLIVSEWILRERDFGEYVGRLPAIVRWCIYYTILFAILGIGVTTRKEFIYFQF